MSHFLKEYKNRSSLFTIATLSILFRLRNAIGFLPLRMFWFHAFVPQVGYIYNGDLTLLFDELIFDFASRKNTMARHSRARVHSWGPTPSSIWCWRSKKWTTKMATLVTWIKVNILSFLQLWESNCSLIRGSVKRVRPSALGFQNWAICSNLWFYTGRRKR